MSKQRISKTPVVALAAAIAFAFAPAANAGLLNWDISGPGTTSATETANETSLAYNLRGWEVFSTQTWTATAIADVAGDYTFDWNYSGFHAYYNVSAFLNAFSSTGGPATLVDAGPANCCSAPSNGFAYTGSYTFTNINAGDILQFTFGGSNNDSDNVLRGSLTLKQLEPASEVPEPASTALIGLALAGLLAARRRSH